MGPLLLPAWPLWPSPRLRLILTSCTDMDLDTMDMDSDTMEDTMADSDTTARGLLMLRLSLILTMDTMDLDTPDTSDMPDSDTGSDTAESSTARGLLMLRLSLILTMDTMDLDTPDTSD